MINKGSVVTLNKKVGDSVIGFLKSRYGQHINIEVHDLVGSRKGFRTTIKEKASHGPVFTISGEMGDKTKKKIAGVVPFTEIVVNSTTGKATHLVPVI